MEHLYQVLEKPLVTEKSTHIAEQGNWVAFQVSRSSNKIQIKEAVEKIFKVTVLKVNTSNVGGKTRRFGKNLGRTQSWKKAMLLLKDGDKIDIIEGA